MSVSVSVPDDLYQKAVEIAKAQRISVDEVPSRIRIRSASWAMRTVRLRNGISIRERLLAISPQDRFYTYGVIESPGWAPSKPAAAATQVPDARLVRRTLKPRSRYTRQTRLWLMRSAPFCRSRPSSTHSRR